MVTVPQEYIEVCGLDCPLFDGRLCGTENMWPCEKEALEKSAASQTKEGR